MAKQTSWLSLHESRMSRRDMLRRALALSLSIPVAGGLLAACGGSDDEDATATTASSGGNATTTTATGGAATETTSGGAETPATGGATPSAGGETTGSPAAGGGQRGGIYSTFEAANPPSLDPYLNGSQGQAFWSSYSYSRLFMLASGPDVPKGSIEVTPDAAAKSEVSEDGLTYTVTLRDNVMWHPPISRTMTAEDVVFAWNRLAGTLPGGTPSERFEDIDFVTSCEAAGDMAVTFTLESPYPFFLQKLADPKIFFLMPKETDTGFNPAEQVVGSGPWVLKEFTPDSKATFDRHPDWHLGPELPYYDGVVVNVIPEYATQLSQFLGGNLDQLVVNGSDLPRLRDEMDGVQIYERVPFPLSVLNFSPHEQRWEDARLRHAVSMALDRDAMLDAGYDLGVLEDAGFEVKRQWHNYIPVAYTEYWLDPKGDEIDPEVAGYFKYDPEKAKALVDEAGGGFDTELHYAAANSRYGEPYRIMSELIVQFLGQIGINTKAVEEDYNSQFIANEGTSSGNFNGLMWIPQTRTDPFAYIKTQYLSPTHGIYGRFKDDEVASRAKEIESIIDPDKLKQAIKDFQNLVGKKMYVVPMVYGSAPTYVAYQPWVNNALQYQTFAQGGATENLPHYWTSKQ